MNGMLVDLSFRADGSLNQGMAYEQSSCIYLLDRKRKDSLFYIGSLKYIRIDERHFYMY